MVERFDFDLVVVGCGAAGLSAAISFVRSATAAGRYPRVAVLETAPEEERGGASAWTNSGFRATRKYGLDPLWIGMVEESSNGLADLDYCRRYEREVPATFAFLDAEGIELQEIPAGLEWIASVKRVNKPNGGGRAIVETFSATLEREFGGKIFYRTELVRLATDDDGRVVGVVARGGDGLLREFNAPSTILACGGFEGNPEMMTRYLGPKACDLKLIAPGVRFNRGAGIRAAMDIGAGTSGQFDWMHAELVDQRSTRADAVIYPHNLGILVNEAAERFCDEGMGSALDHQEVIAREVWLNQNQLAFFIGDGHIKGNQEIEARFDTDHPAIVADTIEDLADQLGLDADALVRTIETFNAACPAADIDMHSIDGVSTDGLTPPKSNWACPIDRAPFFAYPVTAAIVFTCGGIRTDSDARVLTAEGIPVPGLYAAGEIVGVYYHQYQAGTSVLKALTFGRVAGAHAASLVSEPQGEPTRLHGSA